MNGARFLAACLVLAAFGQLAHAQMATSDARSEGEAIAKGVRDATNSGILSDGQAAAVPGFEGTDFPQFDYVENPAGLSTAGEAQRYQDNYRVVADPYRTVFDPATIDLSSARLIESDPDTYLGSGASPDGSAGACSPLPTGSGGTTTYLESCNSQPSQPPQSYSCFSDLEVIPGSKIQVVCDEVVSNGTDAGNYDGCVDALAPYVGQTCTLVDSQIHSTIEDCADRSGYCSTDFITNTYECGTGTPSTSITWGTCNPPPEPCSFTQVCSDASPRIRKIGGVDVELDCWGYRRDYTCGGSPGRSDCTDLAGRSDCSFSHEECLSYEPDGTTCNLWDRWYQCTTSDTGAAPPPAYVCGGDIYCIDGECTQVEREASTEFKDAMVAMNVLGELRDNFDPDNLKIFSGENLKCTKKIFGLSNCCSGKGVPLLTPFLCDREDREVDERDDAGLCYFVGTYCSDRILGVCVTRKQSYCCYGSKLVRILNEQGKAQLGMQWGTPKEPDCEGFLIAQFQRLDLSRMDFREVYAEFVDAAKLPDEIEMSIQIQEKIENYYNINGGT